MKKVLLTGGGGFIGKHAIVPLVEKNYEILPPNSQELNLLDKEQTISYIKFHKPSHLLHLAWDVTPSKYLHNPNNYDWLNSSKELLNAFRENGGERVVVAGSQFECFYDYPYPDAKKKLLEFLQKSDFNYAWGRIYYLYGENEHPNRLVAAVINALLKKEEVKCTLGEQVRDFMYVKDVAKAFVELLDSKVTGVVDIGTGDGIKIKDLIYKIAQKLNGEDLIKLGALNYSENEIMYTVADASKLQNEVGFSPAFTLDEGLDETMDWWKKELNSL